MSAYPWQGCHFTKLEKVFGCSRMASPIAASPTAPMSVEYFGSPPEPLFNEPKNSLSPELLEDTVKLLFQKNELATGQIPLGRSVDEMVGYFKDSNTVQFLFELCRHLG